ncbi:MAG: hypothetical protein AB7U82_01905 [Blastocatellales bacterium]
MNTKTEDNNVINENQPQDANAMQDLPIQTLTESEADYAEEIKGGKKAILTVRKSGGDQLDY